MSPSPSGGRRRAPVEGGRVRAARAVAARFPVVGVGASAGGLEALEGFLKHVAPRCGMAFVVVQHMDPTHEGLLVELLRRRSPLPVAKITDGLKVKPDHVYVIPPNKDLSIVHGVLHLFAPVAPRGLRLPIDLFFRSLAEDLGPLGVGVLLSGMGSDGTLGMRAIHESAGATFVQTPASAKFDGMPRSAIDAGVADEVAPVEELPGKITAFLRHARHVVRPEHAPTDPKAESALEKIMGVLRSASGHDFSPYKRSTLYRRIERRMGLHQIEDIGHYVDYLRHNPKEARLLFDELLIGVTRFFRDTATWDELGGEHLPTLIAACGRNAVLRAWVPACSTGEEAYSVGVVFREALERCRPSRDVSLQIFATDIDAGAVEKARQGYYPGNIAADVSPERLGRFFVEEDRGYRVRKEIRDMVVFAPQNLLQDPPFTKLDVLSCRNLLIYLLPEVQRRLFPLFHYSLKPGGVLVLGSAETVGTFTELFAPLDGKSRLYRRRDVPLTSAPPVEFPSRVGAYARPASDDASSVVHAARSTAPELQAVVEELLLQRFAPVAVLVGFKGDVLYVSGRTGKFLELPAGKATWNLLAMAREGLRHPLGRALQEAARTRQPVALEGLRVGLNGGARVVNVALEPIDEPALLRGTVLVVFTDVGPHAPGGRRDGKRAPARGLIGATHARLEQDLHRAREDLRSTREEAQSAEEELKSANEELQSTNEELQSTNEELTTSKEEMQSMNEELQTLNSELQAKVDELSRTSNDMRNLLDSTEIAVLFLDDELHVRRFTPQAATLIKLIPGDVGRPLADLATDLEYPELYDDAREVLRTLVFAERAVLARGGRAFTVRVMPYRTSDNRIDGVVITFTKHQAGGAHGATARGGKP